EIDGQKRDRLTVGHRERSTQRRLVPDCQEHVDLARRELAIVLFVAFDVRCSDVIECKIPTFLIAEFGHPLAEICIKWGLSRQHTEKAHAQGLGLLLRARPNRPRRRAAEQRDERAPSDHSITSSALVLACLCKSYARMPTTLLAITASTIVKPSSAICTGYSR